MLPTDLTVSVIVTRDDQFLIIEERASGSIVINQPGGHIEAGESPEQATEREALEESGCTISVNGLLGVYLWIHPQTRQNFLRIAYTADLLSIDTERTLDDGIVAVHWYSIADIRRRKKDLRTPMVMRSVEDYLAGRRQPETILSNALPVQQNLDQVLAYAALA
ncbi:MAG: NUDIX hydrolase [Woeseiaceae bacterium]|nr:NUDIX hydrolase [Woeseiaceae bacterium]